MSLQPSRSDERDVEPGLGSADPHEILRNIRSYVVGLCLAGALTAASFYVVATDLIWPPGIPIALAVLAVAQMGVHLVFFLHMTTAPDNTNNALALAFGILIVILLIAGSVWIMSHLNGNMMPGQNMTNIQN
jgi:cytochrome o ubiquinol oxidase operon protein cyoD